MMFWQSMAVCLLMFSGTVLLLWLCAIDLKLRLLPDELTGALALCGVLFQWAIAPYAGPWYNALLGGVVGGGGLLLVRAVANRIYGFETMGLGDVKLLAAGGLWLGIEGVIMALCVGAFAGVLHGLGCMACARAAKSRSGGRGDVRFHEMTIPAGPGFCAGLLLVAAFIYRDVPLFSTVSPLGLSMAATALLPAFAAPLFFSPLNIYGESK